MSFKLTLAEKIANLTKELSPIKGGCKNYLPSNWTHSHSVGVVYDLLEMCNALCIPRQGILNSYAHVTYERLPDKYTHETLPNEYIHGTLPKSLILMAKLWEYCGFLTSSLHSKSEDLKEFRDKVRVLRLVKKYSKRRYHGKKQRVISALKKDKLLFGKHNAFLIDILTQYNFNQLHIPLHEINTKFLSIAITPDKKIIKELTNFQL